MNRFAPRLCCPPQVQNSATSLRCATHSRGSGSIVISPLRQSAKMAMVVKLLNSGAVKNYNVVPSLQLVRKYWNKDWKPGKYPVTEKEREEAAKKYGLPPEVYEPYPDDGLGYGDYPKLPINSAESRDPYYPYDFPEHKRNFNEPLHVEADIYGEDRYDASAKPRFTGNQQLLAFLGVTGGFVGLYYLIDDYRMFRPVEFKCCLGP